MICLTFDTDWMTEQDLRRFLREFSIPGKATFFTHDHFPVLHETDHEIGPHPFIDDLSAWEQRVTALTSRFPREPRGVRAHSCVFSHAMGVGLHAMGYRYVSQAQNLYQPGLAPFRHPWGIWEMPIYYMDNMDFWMSTNWPGLRHEPFSTEVIRTATEREGLFVFDFHPLHVALNTRFHDDYQSVKEKIVKDGVSPSELTFSGRGTRTFFEELCTAMRAKNLVSVTCSDALEQLGCA